MLGLAKGRPRVDTGSQPLDAASVQVDALSDDFARALDPVGKFSSAGTGWAAVIFPSSRPRDGSGMSMQPSPWPEVPAETARIAKKAFRNGALPIRIRDELGSWCADV